MRVIAGEGYRAVDRDVPLREQVAHGEGEEERLGRRAVVQADHAMAVRLAVNGGIARVQDKSGRRVAALGTLDEARRRLAVREGRRGIGFRRHPAAEGQQPRLLPVHQIRPAPHQSFAQKAVIAEQVSVAKIRTFAHGGSPPAGPREK
jgi:hypothetical protein